MYVNNPNTFKPLLFSSSETTLIHVLDLPNCFSLKSLIYSFVLFFHFFNLFWVLLTFSVAFTPLFGLFLECFSPLWDFYLSYYFIFWILSKCFSLIFMVLWSLFVNIYDCFEPFFHLFKMNNFLYVI